MICKMFYALAVMKKLGLRGNHTSTPKTYETYVDKTNDKLISSHGNTSLTQLVSPLILKEMLTINPLAAEAAIRCSENIQVF